MVKILFQCILFNYMNDGYDFTDLSQKKVFIFPFYNNFTIINEFFIEQENCLNIRVVP